MTWTTNPSASAQPDALVAGKVSVNDAGCVVIGSAILVAPPGSALTADGAAINVAGHGVVKLGQLVEGLPGGYGDIAENGSAPEGVFECRSRTAPEREYAVVAEK